MATRSVSFSGWSAMRYFFIPIDSNWKSPVVSPRPKSSYVSLSSSGILSVSSSPSALRIASGTRGLSLPRSATHSFSTVSVLRPRKSILSRPTGSTKCPSYCVVRSLSSAPGASDAPFPLPFAPPLSGVGMTGSVSAIGSREMMTPQACTPGWRMQPSSRPARSMSLWTTGSSELNADSRSGDSLRAFLKVIFGVSGT